MLACGCPGPAPAAVILLLSLLCQLCCCCKRGSDLSSCEYTCVRAKCTHSPGRRFDGIITLTRRLSSKFSDPRDSQQLVRGILASLFPSWLLPAFRVGASSCYWETLA